MRRAYVFPLILPTALAAFACGPGTAGKAVRPDDPSATDAIRGDATISCKAGSYAEPLVVDLPPDQRVDFEAAMASSIALVKYDCKTIELLKDCRLAGKYDFAGVSMKEHVIQLEDRDEVSANLPFSGGKVGAQMDRGSSLNVALVYVGKKSAAAGNVTRASLVGSQCAAATHWLRAVTVGAFAIQTGTKGRVMAAAELFGGGASGKSSSERKVSQKDGDLAACKSATPSLPEPPDQCRSSIRFELVPLGSGTAARAKGGDDKTAKSLNDPCPDGFVLSAGKCTRTGAAAPHLCGKKDTKDCRAQCQAGHGGSCHNLANIALYEDYFDPKASEAQMKKNFIEAMGFWKKACELGVHESCSERGYYLVSPVFGVPAKPKEGEQSLQRACDGGFADGCWELASFLLLGKSGLAKDSLRGLQLTQRACKLGMAFACQELGEYHFKGKHVARDPVQGDRLLTRFCEQGDLGSCIDLASHLVRWFDDDEGPPKPVREIPDALSRARTLFSRACKEKAKRCDLAARLHRDGGDLKTALAMAERGCVPDKPVGKGRVIGGCRIAGQILNDGKGGVKRNAAKVIKYWTGSAHEADNLAAAKMIEKGDGVPKDAAKAKAIYVELCKEYEYKPACPEAARLK